MTQTANAPGRLGDDAMTLMTDPRADRRIVAAFEALGGFAPGVELPDGELGIDQARAYCRAFEDAGAAGNEALRAMLPPAPEVTVERIEIEGADGNHIPLHLHRPKAARGPIPAVVHFHGGGMVLMSAEDPNFVRLRNELANAGVMAIGVEFRNGGGRLGDHPFPAGLNDCAAAVRWVFEQRASLGVLGIVVAGESGGGNLTLATTLKAKREGWVEEIRGAYAMCPYIYGGYGNPTADLPSLVENDGYLLDLRTMAAMVKVYDPHGANATHPLAWPWHASVDDLRGLPPHVISVNELDPLRDEGLDYYRKLLAAGVPTVGRLSAGTPHAGDQIMADVTPDIYGDLVDSIAGFARRVAS